MLGFLALLLPVLLLFKIVSIAITRRQQRAEASRRGCGTPPSPKTRDPTGISLLRDQLKAKKQGRGPQWVAELMDSMGPDVHTIRHEMLDYELILTRDPENIKAAMATQSTDYEIGEFRSKNFRAMLGAGIFSLRGEAWRHHRGMVRQQFARDQISSLDLEERHVQNIFNALHVDQNGWTTMGDIAPLFYNFTLDTATEFVYGHSVHSQNPAMRSTLPVIEGVETPNQGEFSKNLDQGKSWIEIRGALFKFYWLANTPQFWKNCREVKKLADWYIADVLRRKKSKDLPVEAPVDNSGNKNKFVLLHDLANRCDDPLVLRNQTLNILTAGRDTTGALLGWVWYFLSRNPRVFDKLRATVLADFGPNAASPDAITFEKLKSCRYLQYTIKETHRIASVIPINERVSQRDTTLPRGGGPNKDMPIFVPKGVQVLMSPYAVHTRRDIWGDDALEFNPERWETAKVVWEYTPFGGGPRMCLGRKLSEFSSEAGQAS